MYYKELAKSVRYYKKSKKGRELMRTSFDEYLDKVEESTRLDTKFHDIKNIMESLDLTLEQALSAIKVSDADRAILTERF